MPVFDAKINVTAIHSTLRQDDKGGIRCSERDLLLSRGGVEGTDDCPLRPRGDHTTLPALAMVSSKGSSPGAVVTSLSPFLSCGPIPPELGGSRGWLPSLEFVSQVCLVDSSYMAINARGADCAGVKLPSEQSNAFTIKEDLPLHQQKRDYLAVKPILYTKIEIVEFSRGLIQCECVSWIK